MQWPTKFLTKILEIIQLTRKEGFALQFLRINNCPMNCTSQSLEKFRGAGLADMQSISKHNKGVRFVLCVIDIYSKYTWVVLLKMLLQSPMHFKTF